MRDGVPVTLRPKQLVLATGMSGAPQVPAYESAENFRGVQCHSSAYRGGEAYAGKRCVVIGSNNSATTLPPSFGNAARRSRWCSAPPPWSYVPRRRCGTSPTSSIPRMRWRPGSARNRPISSLPPVPMPSCPRCTGPFYDQIRQEDAEFYRQLEAAGFMIDFGEDASGLSMKYLRRSSGYYIDVGASDLIIRGEIGLKSRVKVSHILPEGVALDDDTVLPADLIIYAHRLRADGKLDRAAHLERHGAQGRACLGPWLGHAARPRPLVR